MSDCPQIVLTVPIAPIAQVSLPAPISLQLCNAAGGSSVLVSGSRPLALANLTGIGGVTVTQSGSFVFFSGSAGSGDVTQAQLVSASGALVSQISAASAGVLGVNGISGFVSLIGQGGVSLTTSGQTIFISGGSGDGSVTQVQLDALSGWAAAGLQSTGSSLYSMLTGASGELKTQIDLFSGQFQVFISGIPTGIDSLTVNYPQPFSYVPVVESTLSVTGFVTYMINVRSVNSTGFLLGFSDIVAESGVSINVLAKQPS